MGEDFSLWPINPHSLWMHKFQVFAFKDCIRIAQQSSIPSQTDKWETEIQHVYEKASPFCSIEGLT